MWLRSDVTGEVVKFTASVNHVDYEVTTFQDEQEFNLYKLNNTEIVVVYVNFHNFERP